MKRFILFLASVTIFGALMVSCEIMAGNENCGEISLRFSDSFPELTKGIESVPDSNDFILTVRGPSGDVLFNGTYGSAPQTLLVQAGTCMVEIVSIEFNAPQFSSPQFGDSQLVFVKEGAKTRVTLDCRLLNCGVRLNTDSGFLDNFPDASLFLRSDDGKLMYGYTERRIAYFKPGAVSLFMSRGGEDKVLFTRSLEAREILTVKVGGGNSGADSGKTSAELQFGIDTTAVWSSLEYNPQDNPEKGKSKENAFSIYEACQNVGESQVWVYGYIVGGDLTSASASFEAPFSTGTNLLIAGKSSVRDKESCISVQLPKGNVRDALNLVDNPSVLGRKVFLKGDIVDSYFGITGLKSVSDYYLPE